MTATSCPPGELELLLAWCGQRSIQRGPVSDPRLHLLLPAGVAGYGAAGPLTSTDAAPIGVLVAGAAQAPFTRQQETLLHDLLEPLGVAALNDQRLRELARLREALEADKRALLTRLERHELAEAIVGADNGLREVLNRVDQVAPTDVPVLILGETGSGKEVVARAIHARSRRRAGPVMRVNCGALPPGLVDSELFGHERGSFTGAVATRQGWFERANGGTLFLDEIGELPLDAQVRLLRVLQDGTFERVGGHRSLHADVRIVAATNRDLHEMVESGRFREDLWYRIGVFPIRLPALRDRPGDIPSLAAHFSARTGLRLAGRPLVPSPHDLELLLAYHWPGNVRELAAVIERAAILGDGRRLDIAGALGVTGPTALRAARGDARRTDRRDEPQPRSEPGGGDTLDAATVVHIERALQLSHGRIEGPFGAARRLGLNPNTLRARMRKLGVDWRRFRAAPPGGD